MPNLLPYIPATLAVLALIAAVARAATPVATLVPPRWRWLMPALLLACSLATDSLARAETDGDALVAIVSVVVAVVLAAQRGLAQPGDEEPPADGAAQ